MQLRRRIERSTQGGAEPRPGGASSPGDSMSRILAKIRGNTGTHAGTPTDRLGPRSFSPTGGREWYGGCDGSPPFLSFGKSDLHSEATMSPKKRRKIYGVRRESRRTRGWTR